METNIDKDRKLNNTCSTHITALTEQDINFWETNTAQDRLRPSRHLEIIEIETETVRETVPCIPSI